MITPKFLKKGDKVGIVAPARKIVLDEIQAAIRVLESWGLEVVLGKNLFKSNDQFSGTDKERAEDLQIMFDDSEIKAVLCARGGYGTIRTLDHINFDGFIKDPKWIVGYSDVTALHAHVNQNLGIKTIHGTMPFNFPEDTTENNAVKTLKQALFGYSIEYTIINDEFNRKGKVKGELIGGNLSVLYSVAGTKYDINTKGKILVIEDLDEYLYHIDRIMMNLKLGGKLSGLKALIVGGMSDMNDNKIPFGKNAYEIIQEAVQEYNYPVCFNFPLGHIKNNFSVILGETISLNVNEENVVFSF